jgi:hypothetical protein
MGCWWFARPLTAQSRSIYRWQFLINQTIDPLIGIDDIDGNLIIDIHRYRLINLSTINDIRVCLKIG